MPNPKPVDEEEITLVEVEDEPSDDTLERAPDRVLAFLRGVANNPTALALLVPHGYSDEAHAEGWGLLTATGALPAATKPIGADSSVADAIAALDQWDNNNFSIIAAALARKFPTQRAAVFKELVAAEGAASVIAVETLLERLAMLEKGKLTDHAKTDKEASAYLEKRGYTLAQRKALAEQVKTAKSLPTPVFESASQSKKRKDARRSALLSLHGWWREWGTLARRKIVRRDLLVNLGLAVRKKKQPAEEKKE